MSKPKFLLQPAKTNPHGWANKEWYFNLVASNGKVIATSEIYATKRGAKLGIKAVKNAVPEAAIKEVRYE